MCGVLGMMPSLKGVFPGDWKKHPAWKKVSHLQPTSLLQGCPGKSYSRFALGCHYTPIHDSRKNLNQHRYWICLNLWKLIKSTAVVRAKGVTWEAYHLSEPS